MNQGFENGHPVPSVPFDSELAIETKELLRIEDLLIEFGVPQERIPALVDRLADLIGDITIVRTAESFRFVLANLGGTAAATALMRALLGSGGESLRCAAKRIGVTHRAISKAEKRIRKRLGIHPDH